MSGFVQEGFTLSFRGSGVLSDRDVYFLEQGVLASLLPVCFYRENLDWVFVYDLEVGFSLGELAERGEALVSVSLVVSFLEGLLVLIEEFFLAPDGFLVSVDSLFVAHEGSSPLFVYCPLFHGALMPQVLSLVALCFRGEVWFSKYLEGLEGLSGGLCLRSLVVLLGSFREPVVSTYVDGVSTYGEGGSAGGSLFVRVFSFGVCWLSGLLPGQLLGVAGGVFLLGVVFGLLFV